MAYLHGNLWRNCIGAWCPSQQSQLGHLLYDFALGRHGSLYLGSGTLVDMWQPSSGQIALDTTGGTDRVVQLGTESRGMLAQLSVSLWFRSNAALNTYETLIGKEQGGGWASNGFGIFCNSPAQLRFWVTDYSSGTSTATFTNDGVWRHLCGVYDGANVILYVAGVAGTVGSRTGLVNLDTAANFNLGAINNTNNSSYTAAGQYDDIRLYDRALTYEEVQLLSTRRGVAYAKRARTVAALRQGVRSGSGAIVAVGTIAGTGAKVQRGAGSVLAVGAIAGTGARVQRGAGSVIAVGTIAGTGTRVQSGTGSIASIGSIVGASATTRSGSGSVLAVGIIAGTGARVQRGAGSVIAVGVLSGAGDQPSNNGSGAIVAVGTLAGTGDQPSNNGSGAIVAVGTIAGTGARVQSGTGSIASIGSIVGASATTRSGSGSVLAVGAIAGTGRITLSGSGTVVGIGTLLGVGRASRYGYAFVIGVGALLGEGEETVIEQTQHAQRFRRNDMRMLLRTHGESITYYPSGRASRVIRALIERDVAIPSEVEQVAQAIVLRVLDDPITGVASYEIDDGGDEVGLRIKIGGAVQRRQITRRITSVAGVTRFLVR